MKRLMALAIAAIAIGALPSTAAASGCGLTSTNGTVTRTLGARLYELHVPQGLTGSQVALLLSLHGAGSNGYQDELSTGWSGYADRHNFIAAYPDAAGPESGVWDPYTANSPDVAFLRQVVSDISSHWCIDPRRIYVDGWSNGAVMSQRAACDAADLFASATSYGGGDPTTSGTAAPCKPSRPISVGLIVGQYDFTYAGLAMDTSLWQGVDHCSSTPTQSTDQYGSSSTYGCASSTQLWTRVVTNTSHNWPFGAQGDDQRNRMWAFFGANPHP
jgi:polyhydroxybutyrate depolymerase